MAETATETKTEPIATQQENKNAVLPTQDDVESKMAALEAEKARLVEEKSNYQMAYLKEKSRNSKAIEGETEDEKMRRIAKETLADSQIAQIAYAQEELLKKTIKENKELKLAQLNKSTATPPAAAGAHSESAAVQDTLVTPEQLSALKARGWNDKDIERYKKNFREYSGR